MRSTTFPFGGSASGMLSNANPVYADVSKSFIDSVPKSFVQVLQPHLLVPRGGASADKTSKVVKRGAAKSSPRDSKITSFSETFVSKERLPKLVCTVVSVIYFMFYENKRFFLVAGPYSVTPENWNFKDGFCVTGLFSVSTSKGTTDACSAAAGN